MLTQEEMDNVNSRLPNKIVKNMASKKTADPDGFTGEFHQTFK